MARSPTLRPDPRHQRSHDPNSDTVIKLIKDIQRPDDGFNSHLDIQSARSPIVCKRKAVLPAIGVSVSITDACDDNKDLDDSFERNHPLCAKAPTIVEPDDSRSNNVAVSYNEITDSTKPQETDEASLSTSTADSGFAEKDIENLIEPSQADRYRVIDTNQPNDFNQTSEGHCESSDASYKASYSELIHRQPCNDLDDDVDNDFDDSEFFLELQKPSMRKKTRSRLEAGCGVADGRTRSRLASRNSVSMYEEDEPRFGDDSMLKPVSHQSVVAEDKLVSSRCRRSSKLLDKLMLGDYNAGQSTTPSFLSHSSSTTKGHHGKSFRSVSNSLSMAGQMLRPRTLPQLPPILKRQRTMEAPDERHSPTLRQPGDWERPSVPSPSLTPPSPGASDCDDTQSEEEPPLDFIDCR